MPAGPMNGTDRQDNKQHCGLTSLLPMSCRGRAEAFARRLHSRLRSLGSEPDADADSTDESSWLASHEAQHSITSLQPRHSSDFDFGPLDSPASPEEEICDSELERMFADQTDNLNGEGCRCPNTFGRKASVNGSSDSNSSDGPYFDPDGEPMLKPVNGALPVDGEALYNHHIFHPISLDTSQLPLTKVRIPQSRSFDSAFSANEEEFSSLETASNATDGEKLFADAEVEVEAEVEDDDTTTPTIQSEESFLDKDCPTRIEVFDSPVDSQLELNEENEHHANEATSSNLLCVDELKRPDSEPPPEDKSDDDPEDRSPRVRRCSSLKTGKTPPGTPGRKKIVRFADVLGLDLADVRTFLDEIPKIPSSAYQDLSEADVGTAAAAVCPTTQHLRSDKVLMPLFQQPVGFPDFLDRVRDRQVCLENAVMNDAVAMSVVGTVRVRNLDFNKSVHVRYTLDEWRSFADMQAAYVENSCDGFSDKFHFTIYAHTLGVGERLEFAVRFSCKGCQYWDNNVGVNYCFQCLPAATNTTFTPITAHDDAWDGASFYYEDRSAEACEEVRSVIQDYVTKSLATRKRAEIMSPQMFGVILVLMIACLLVFLRKAIL